MGTLSTRLLFIPTTTVAYRRGCLLAARSRRMYNHHRHNIVLTTTQRRPLSSPSHQSRLLRQQQQQGLVGQQQPAKTAQLHSQRKSHQHLQRVTPKGPSSSSSSRRGKASLANDTMSQSSPGFVTEKATPPQNSWLEMLESWLRKTRTLPVPRWITPRHYTITISEVLGHSSFLLVAISYAVDDFLMLRCIAVVGSSAMLFFTYFQ